MKIILAKSAGFCFGVARALEIVYKCAEDKSRTYHTLGPIIHNAQVVSELAGKGIDSINNLNEKQDRSTIIIRTHGVPKKIYDRMDSESISYVDVTCPYVKKIHNIVKKHSAEGYRIVIIGDNTHPEVIGINGWCGESAVIIKNEEDARQLLNIKNPICVVSQTTFNYNEFKKITNFLKKTCQTILIFDTICKATEERQNEAAELSKKVDAMIVLGGKNSSNTQKLFDICKTYCNETYCFETIDEFDIPNDFKYKTIGITAGASTPSVIIKEAISKMEMQDQSFAELFEESLKTLNTGDVITGKVIEVRPNEVIVDLQVKQDGIIPASEISDDPNLLPSDVVKVGDDIEVFVVRVNDADGNIMLSKRKLDARKTWEEFQKAAEDGNVLEGKVTNIVNGGMIVMYKDIKVFVPASQASDRYTADLSDLVGKTVPFVVLEITEKRRRVVGSVKKVLAAQKAELEAKFWESAEVGGKYTGVVKSLTSFGAFVDLGGIDGLVHISELSWNRIKHPSEVVKVGDVIEVYIKDISENKKISLGFKKAEDNPWAMAQEQLHVDDIVKVKIVKMMPFGAFAEILPSIDGLIHISQISYERIARPQDVLAIGQEVEAKIVELDFENKRIGLSIKATLPEPDAIKPEAEASAEEEAEEAPVYKEELGVTIGDAIGDAIGVISEEE